jgi:hypothetical protein
MNEGRLSWLLILTCGWKNEPGGSKQLRTQGWLEKMVFGVGGKLALPPNSLRPVFINDFREWERTQK